MNLILDLPLGIVINDKLEKKVTVRQMNAGDRLEMSKMEAKRKPIQVFTNLLTRCIVSFGENTPPHQSLVESLAIGDRDYILLEIRKISMGEKITMAYKCTGCDQKMEIEIDLKDIKVSRPDPTKYEIVSGIPILHFENTKISSTLKIRVPNGRDQEDIFPMWKRNILEGDYELYKRCIKEWKGTPGPFGIDFINSLTINEIEWIEECFKSNLPGPNWLHIIECDMCGAESFLDLQKTDFLFKIRG